MDYEKLCCIVNFSASQKVNPVGETDIPEHTLKAVVEKVVESVSKGSKPSGISLLPKEFYWKEYSEWEDKIFKLSKKPYLWRQSKGFLYINSMAAIAIEASKIESWKNMGIKFVKFNPSSDSCQLCKKLKGKYPIDQAPLICKDRHPGCRCCFLPA